MDRYTDIEIFNSSFIYKFSPKLLQPNIASSVWRTSSRSVGSIFLTVCAIVENMGGKTTNSLKSCVVSTGRAERTRGGTGLYCCSAVVFKYPHQNIFVALTDLFSFTLTVWHGWIFFFPLWMMNKTSRYSNKSGCWVAGKDGKRGLFNMDVHFKWNAAWLCCCCWKKTPPKKQRNINKAAVFSYCRLMFSDTMGAPTFAFLPTEEV